MRLIDIDKLLFSLEEWKLNETPISTYPKPKEFTADDMQRMIWRTIRDCESAVEEQPTVEAIPKEWIVNKWAEKFWKVINGKKYYTGDGYDTVWDMIEDWEKENGK